MASINKSTTTTNTLPWKEPLPRATNKNKNTTILWTHDWHPLKPYGVLVNIIDRGPYSTNSCANSSLFVYIYLYSIFISSCISFSSFPSLTLCIAFAIAIRVLHGIHFAVHGWTAAVCRRHICTRSVVRVRSSQLRHVYNWLQVKI